jgi:hypothetical protein
LSDQLASNPKQFPKKSGKLATMRAAEIRFADGVVWRAVFELSESERVVRVLALGPHDEAYEAAQRRSK